MAYQCKNCGQTTLETDTVCWHCGQSLSQRKEEPETAVSTEESTEERPFPLASFMAYSGLTVAIIIALFWVMGRLGSQPQVVQGIGPSLKPGWTAVTDRDRTFTLNLPAQWLRLDRYDSEQEAEFIEQARQNGQYQAALAPYDAMADDRQLLFLAVSDQSGGETAPSTSDLRSPLSAGVSPFIVIARSRQLSQFTPEEMLAALQDGPAGISLLRSNLTEGVNGNQQLLSILTMPYADHGLRCQHFFFKEETESFLVVGCASEDTYHDFTNIFHDILVSFQPLLS
ncbi:MAG: hypothetical protein GY803_07170 [Chloroflexi bacterium]|nr:hypothetical protein [Chloroflexota bacterium]